MSHFSPEFTAGLIDLFRTPIAPSQCNVRPPAVTLDPLSCGGARPIPVELDGRRAYSASVAPDGAPTWLSVDRALHWAEWTSRGGRIVAAHQK
jgi:hypothetical protein